MEYELFKAVGMAAGIGGISLGVLLFVLRDIIKKNIFPKFKDEKNAYRLLRMIIWSVWTVALFGIAAWVVTTIGTRGESGFISISNDRYSTNMRFSDYDVIINQYQQIHSKPLDDELRTELRKAVNLLKGGDYNAATPAFRKIASSVETPALHGNLGGLLALQNSINAAREEYSKAIAIDPEFAPVQLNLGLLEQSVGNLEAAEKHLAKIEDQLPEARKLLRTMTERRQAGHFETEPNNTGFEPNVAPLEDWIQASISRQADVDFFSFTTPGVARDIVRVELENQNVRLQPRIDIYNSDRGHLHESRYSVTAGQNIGLQFSVEPNLEYLVRISSRGGFGRYQFRIVPKQAYDIYEPNEDLFNAQAIAIGTEIHGNILDERDRDHFRIETNTSAVTIRVGIKNQSTSLQPRLDIFNANRRHLHESRYSVTGGQDITLSFGSDAAAVYYVRVVSRGGRGGYVLTIEEIPKDEGES